MIPIKQQVLILAGTSQITAEQACSFIQLEETQTLIGAKPIGACSVPFKHILVTRNKFEIRKKCQKLGTNLIQIPNSKLARRLIARMLEKKEEEEAQDSQVTQQIGKFKIEISDARQARKEE